MVWRWAGAAGPQGAWPGAWRLPGQELDLSRTGWVDDDFLRTLEGHPSLRSLRIKEEPITDSGLQSLHTLPLVYLDLDHCVVSEKACSDLQSALPNCEIAGPYLA